jgi:nucleoside-diphosphate-sugar epimerase
MVLIIGCGYVGEKVAYHLLDDPSLTVTTRSKEHLQLLHMHFPNAFLLNTTDLKAFQNLLEGHDCLILTMAPKNVSDYEGCYLQTMLNLKQALTESSSLNHIIYTSTSSVYGECGGQLATETTPLQATTAQGQILIEAENTLLSLKTKERKICIFRVSEIYGPNRSIKDRVERLLKKKAPGDGSQLTNMIHVDDLVAAILFAKNHQLDGIYNICDDEHMPRKIMYDKISQLHHMEFITWDPSMESIHRGNKCLSNKNLKETGFTLKFPQRMLDDF